MDEHGIFSDPTKTGTLGELTLKEGPRVGVITVGDGMPELFFDEADDLLQAGRDDVVIVAAESVGGDLKFRILNLERFA